MATDDPQARIHLLQVPGAIGDGLLGSAKQLEAAAAPLAALREVPYHMRRGRSGLNSAQ